jgi:uncharacterized membrane protein
MNTLIFGLIIFFTVHSISIINDAWRNRMAEKTGEWAWKGIYGLVAVAGLYLIVRGYGLARLDPVVLYSPPTWLRYPALLLLLPVFPLLLAAYLPGRIQHATKHPMLVAVKLWATAHLLVNGTLPAVALFGSFLIWAIADRISLKHRLPRPVPHVPETRINDGFAVVIGLACYAAFVLWLHAWLIGAAIIPG